MKEKRCKKHHIIDDEVLAREKGEKVKTEKIKEKVKKEKAKREKTMPRAATTLVREIFIEEAFQNKVVVHPPHSQITKSEKVVVTSRLVAQRNWLKRTYLGHLGRHHE